MFQDHINHVADYYDKLVTEHGDSYKACDYGSWESQETKMEVISSLMKTDGTVLDVGCGLGEWWGHGTPCYGYTGVDISPEMIKLAKKKWRDVNFRNLNILTDDIEQHDWVIANGLFYIDTPQQYGFTIDMIDKMWSLCNKGLIFNMPSAMAPTKNKGELYWDAASVWDIAHVRAPYVTLRHDYMEHDFTVAMYKK